MDTSGLWMTMQNANDKCRSPITNKCLDNGWVLLLLLILSTTEMRPHKQRMMMLNKNWKYDNRSAVTINVSTNLTWWTSMIIMTAVTPFLIGIEVCSGHVDRNVGVRWWWQQYVKTELSPAQASPAQPSPGCSCLTKQNMILVSFLLHPAPVLQPDSDWRPQDGVFVGS